MSGQNRSYVWKRVWDLPTRVFHGLLVCSVSIGWWIGDHLSFANISWHFYLGYGTGGLLVFRMVWGLFGSPASRLEALFHPLQSTMTYVMEMRKREPSGFKGHSPVGSLSVLALLGCLSLQVVTGLFSQADDLFSAGPLAEYVSSQTIQWANFIHEMNSKILLGLIVAHIAALMFYLIWKRENLMIAMVSGKKLLKEKSK